MLEIASVLIFVLILWHQKRLTIKKNGFPNPKGAGLNITYASHCTHCQLSATRGYFFNVW